MTFPDYYPPSPRQVPETLTEPSAPFRKHVNLVALALLIFFVLYFGLIALLGVAMVFCLLSKSVPLYFVALVPLVPFLFLIKNLFNRQKMEKSYDVEIRLEDHPRLEVFLECICAETGAPMPDRVVANFEVNASAGSTVSLASLLLAPKLTLTLGLGLLNVLNVTEFKALLAHEFGHLSQMKMKSAPYVRLAMQIMFNILHGTKFVGLDKLMEAIFIFVVKLNQALSREMEFHADLVAVSVAGSDAVPHLLYKTYWAEACLRRTVEDLDAAQDHGLFSRDIFLHQTQAGRFLRKAARNEALGKPPVLLPDPRHTFQVFEPDADEDQMAKMWDSHPPNHEREINAKAHYIRTEFDESSPWILFSNAAELREKVSRQFYREFFNVRKKEVKWSSGEHVQEFLDEEYAETIFDVSRYGFLYNHRNIISLDLRALRDHSEANPNTPETLLASHRTLYTPAVKKFAEVFQRHFEEMELLRAIKEKWYVPTRKQFKMRGRKMHVREVRDLIGDTEKEIKADLEWLRDFDRKVFVTYFEMALLINRAWAEELYERYRFHFVIQGMWTILQSHKTAMHYMFAFLNEHRGDGVLDENTYHILIEVFRRAYAAVQSVLEEADDVTFPELANMPAGKPIRPFLLQGRLSDQPTHFDTHVKPEWLNRFSQQFHGVEKRLSRLHFKSLGNILTLQEALGERAEKTWSVMDAIMVKE